METYNRNKESDGFNKTQEILLIVFSIIFFVMPCINVLSILGIICVFVHKIKEINIFNNPTILFQICIQIYNLVFVVLTTINSCFSKKQIKSKRIVSSLMTIYFVTLPLIFKMYNNIKENQPQFNSSVYYQYVLMDYLISVNFIFSQLPLFMIIYFWCKKWF